jgi:hypothetical protein
MHATNSIGGILYEIKITKNRISLQRISTTPVESRFGRTRMHAGVHQTMAGLVKAMEQDEAMKFLYVDGEVKKRRLAYGEIVAPWSDWGQLGDVCLIFAEAVLIIVGFPAEKSRAVRNVGDDMFPEVAERLMSDLLLPFAKTNLYMMGSRKRRSLYQELQGVTPSCRRIILSSKSDLRAVVGPQAADPIEQHLAALLGRPRVVTDELKLLVTQVLEARRVSFEGPHALHRATKREVLDWIGEQWDVLGDTFTMIAVNQRGDPIRYPRNFVTGGREPA